MSFNLTEADEGKTVLDDEGNRVGIVVAVRHGVAHVDADPGVVSDLKRRLDAGSTSEDTYAVEADDVAEVRDDELVLGVTV